MLIYIYTYTSYIYLCMYIYIYYIYVDRICNYQESCRWCWKSGCELQIGVQGSWFQIYVEFSIFFILNAMIVQTEHGLFWGPAEERLRMLRGRGLGLADWIILITSNGRFLHLGGPTRWVLFWGEGTCHGSMACLPEINGLV